MMINWRASLTPAAMVIRAPIAYVKVVAVKKLVVRFRNGPLSLQQGELLTGLFFLSKMACALYSVCIGFTSFTLKKLECSKQAIA